MKIRNKVEASGLTLLTLGVALLAFTFVNAYLLLIKDIGIIATSDLAAIFGEALGPLVVTCIRIMYLGIMAWIGSMLTLRGLPLLTHQKQVKLLRIRPKTKMVKQASKGKKKGKPSYDLDSSEEELPLEEFVVIPEPTSQRAVQARERNVQQD